MADGSERSRVSDGDVTRAIAAKWHSMSTEEQLAATEDAVKSLQDREENHKKGTHTVPIQAFHDARATVATIQREVSDASTLR